MRDLWRDNRWLAVAVRVSGALTFLLGLSVMIGFLLHNMTLIQINETLEPMKMTTAVLFCLTGVCLYLLPTHRKQVRVLSVFTAVQALVMLIYADSKINSIFCFFGILTSIFLLTYVSSNLERLRLKSVILASGSVMTVGIIALIGYMSGYGDIFPLNYTGQIAAHSAVSFILIAALLATVAIWDNPVNQEVMIGMLENAGITLAIAKNGAEAFSMARAQKYDMIFMDCQMPEMDGFEATSLIRRTSAALANIPIIALTANVMKGDREKCLAAGMNDYLGKPINEEELQEMIMKWLPEDKKSGTVTSEQVSSPPPPPVQVEVASIPLSQDTDERDDGKIDMDTLEKLQKALKTRFPTTLRTFINSSTSLIERLEAAVANQDAGEVREAAHSLKSSGQMGAAEMYRLAVVLEESAKQGDLSHSPEDLGKLRQETEYVHRKLETLLSELEKSA